MSSSQARTAEALNLLGPSFARPAARNGSPSRLPAEEARPDAIATAARLAMGKEGFAAVLLARLPFRAVQTRTLREHWRVFLPSHGNVAPRNGGLPTLPMAFSRPSVFDDKGECRL